MSTSRRILSTAASTNPGPFSAADWALFCAISLIWALAVLAAGLLGTAAAYWIMGTLVGRVGSIRASFITYLIPVVALLLGVLLRGDRVGTLAIAGVVLAARRER